MVFTVLTPEDIKGFLTSVDYNDLHESIQDVRLRCEQFRQELDAIHVFMDNYKTLTEELTEKAIKKRKANFRSNSKKIFTKSLDPWKPKPKPKPKKTKKKSNVKRR